MRRDEDEIYGLSWEKPARKYFRTCREYSNSIFVLKDPPCTAESVGCPELLLQLPQDVLLVLAPAHVGEEAQQEGDGEQCLVQQDFDEDDS